jgi:hypothetical protein
MTLLLHTDIGHDPDDIIALSYLISRGDYVPSIVSISPGFSEQALIVDSIYRQFGLNRPTIRRASAPNKVYQRSKALNEIIALGKDDSMELCPNSPIECSTTLVIGPPKGLDVKCYRMIFQGGYSPNSISPLEKFAGQMSVPSFNPNGARRDFLHLRDKAEINRRYYVGKNVCHGYKKLAVPANVTKGFPPAIKRYYDGLSPDKAMHDLLAAMMMIYPDRGVWGNEMPVFVEGGMSTVPTDREIYTLVGLAAKAIE